MQTVKNVLFFLVLIFHFHATAKAQLIKTIAGNSNIGDGGSALAAGLSRVWSVGQDAAGNIYVPDAANNRVRKIEAVSGIITTFAGNGKASYSGDGGPAKLAGLNFPMDVFVAPSGNIYISDYSNFVIRKVNGTTGIISTVAGTGVSGYTGDGGLATNAQIGQVWRLCVDIFENVYLSDATFYVVRKIDHATGKISTFAGNGTAGFSGDGGLATLAQLDGDQNAICTDATGSNIYIADFSNQRIRKVNTSTNIITTVVGGGNIGNTDGVLATVARISLPRSVCVDNANNIYIGFTANCKKVDAITNKISTVVGAANINSSGFSGDGGPATLARTSASGGAFVDGDGNIFVCDNSNLRVRKVPAATGIINTIAGNGGRGIYCGDSIEAAASCINGAASVCTDSNNNIFVADAANFRIRRIDAISGVITTYAGTGVAGTPNDGADAANSPITTSNIQSDAEGNIYFNENFNRVKKIDVVTKKITTVAGNGTWGYSGDNGAATSAATSVFDFCVDNSGSILIADRNNAVVRKVTNGIITTIAGTGTTSTNTYTGDGGPALSATFGALIAICTDKERNIYLADNGFGVIRKIDAITKVITTVAGKDTSTNQNIADGAISTTGPIYTSEIATDDAGNIYFFQGARVRKVDKSTNIVSTIAGNGSSGLSGDGGIATNASLSSLKSFTISPSASKLLIAEEVRLRSVDFGEIGMCPPSSGKTIVSNITGNSYQWQLNKRDGAGFVNITNNANFSGTGAASLQLVDIPSSWSGYQLRCIVDQNLSYVFTLNFAQQWTGTSDTAWENAANWSCGTVPDENSDVFIDPYKNILVSSNVKVKSLKVGIGSNVSVAPGFTLTISQ